MIQRLTIILILILFSVKAYSDTWANPTIKKYFSNNGNYMLIVYPTEIPDNYYKWESAKPKKKARFTEKDTTIVLGHTILYQIDNNDTILIWNK